MSRRDEEFFVGYLDTPPGVKAFARVAGGLLLAMVVAVGAVLGLSHRPAGPAAWDITEVLEFEGVLQTAPYGVLHVEDGSLLLVEATKYGLRPDAAVLQGRRVMAKGTLLKRDGDRMLALLPGDEGLRDQGEGRLPEVERLGPLRLSGSIVDSKCFLGAMKPGDGAGHRPCAQLCIRGGIPPVLITDDPQHPKLILSDVQGRPVNQAVLPFVAEPISLSGEWVRQGDRDYLRTVVPKR